MSFYIFRALLFQGYSSGLEKIFQSAGLLQNRKPDIYEKQTTEAPTISGSLFTDLAMCNKVTLKYFSINFVYFTFIIINFPLHGVI